MEYRAWKEWQLSRLMLGTVQFGIPYGVANRTGQPDYSQVLAMTRAAIEGGVNCFDTAAAYGNSEEVLGRALRDLGALARVMVATKVRPLTPFEVADATLAKRAIEDSVADSRRRLGMDCLHLVLFHRYADAAHLSVLVDLRDRGWLRYAGVSCDHLPGPAAACASMEQVAALQLPANVLDRRHERAGTFRQAATRGVAVFIRSVYLQGLLVMPDEAVPPALRNVLPVRRRLADIARDSGISLPQLALRYMLAHEGVTCLLTGVETVAQVRENIGLFERGPLGPDIVQAVDAAVPDLPDGLITPVLWPRSAAHK